MQSKRLWRAASLALIVISMGALLYMALHDPSSQPAPTQAAAPAASVQVHIAAPIYTSGPLSKLSADEQQLAQAMIERFGKKLQHPFWRIRAIESLMKVLQKKYPNDWKQRLRDLLKLFFPEDAAQLMATLDAYDSYNDWLKSMQGDRQFGSREERLQAVWDKRRQLFGQDADLIWAEEIKQEKVDAALKKLDGSGLPVAAKVDSYVKTLTEVYGQDALNPDKSHPVQMMEGFLTLDSVQGELRAQSPEQQRQTLRKLREGLGLKDDAIQRLEALDEQRQQRYSAGESYMTQRSALEKQYQGETLQLQLNALQNRLFGEEEAQFIRNEEASGYYRYKEKQVVGVN
ncbi:lipase chaperone protein [Fluviicoccus keumensis]|uniref:Lipase chaperone n=1 Tax=Fluviicoccus keumensis TaxID=1435465 RepID=A0A4Q7YK94_9GAMM|nr:lipase secretion chaperone [Fluviicoccus keumensis]RZU36915.1 lipase chaperone protein [Fluviicoccus keumensis]